jgi:hypothetical protein
MFTIIYYLFYFYYLLKFLLFSNYQCISNILPFILLLSPFKNQHKGKVKN